MKAVELALAKQRLRMEAARQREELSSYAAGLAPLIAAADKLHQTSRWIGRHPELVAGGLAFLAVVRPGVRRFLWRWGKRAWIVRELWRKNGASIFGAIRSSSSRLSL